MAEPAKPTTAEPKAAGVKLKITAEAGAPDHAAGLSFVEGKTKTVAVSQERAQMLRRTAGLKIEEVK